MRRGCLAWLVGGVSLFHCEVHAIKLRKCTTEISKGRFAKRFRSQPTASCERAFQNALALLSALVKTLCSYRLDLPLLRYRDSVCVETIDWLGWLVGWLALPVPPCNRASCTLVVDECMHDACLACLIHLHPFVRSVRSHPLSHHLIDPHRNSRLLGTPPHTTKAINSRGTLLKAIKSYYI
jgi:hypothetical protein